MNFNFASAILLIRMRMLLLILLILCPYSLADECTKHLHTLASYQKDFVQCSTLNSVPVQLCTACQPKYRNMTISYSVLKETPNCTEKYFDKDRINIVATMQNILTGLWSRAYCDDCFQDNHSIVFDQKLTEFNLCFNSAVKDDTICEKCLPEYLNLNDFYKSITERKHRNTCYDLQDAMNRTRSLWSNQYNCCHREFNPTLFLVASILVGLLPIIFYASTFALTKYYERNHGILNEDPEFDSTNEATSSRSAIPNTTTRSPTSSTKPVKSFDESESDDSEDNSALKNFKNMKQN